MKFAILAAGINKRGKRLYKTGIDLPSEESGLMPSQEWVERAYHRKWYAGEVISVAIGQGAVQTTPLQLARLIGGIASGGVFKQPHMMKDAPNVPEEKFPISEATVEKSPTRCMALSTSRTVQAENSGLPAWSSAASPELLRSSGIAKSTS